MIGPGAGIDDPWDGEFGTGNAAAMAAWRERERRQRTVRLLMMFLLMLLLMDGEEQNSTSSKRRREMQLRKAKLQKEAPPPLEESLFESRTKQDFQIMQALQTHGRKKDLAKLNKGRHVDHEIEAWLFEQKNKDELKVSDPEDRKKVYHYPWNATGFYRGEWTREQDGGVDETAKLTRRTSEELATSPTIYKTPMEMESSLQKVAQARGGVSMMLLPKNTKLKLGGASFNATKLELMEQAANLDRYNIRMRNKRPALSLWSMLSSQQPSQLIVPEEDDEDEEDQATTLKKLTLTKNSGKVAFQLYSRSVPAMKELSLLEGFVKLYDSGSVGYSSRKDVLLRVRGVILHSIGRVSMVANDSPGRSALVISSKGNKHASRRRLEESLSALPNSSSVSEQKKLEGLIRDDAFALYPFDSLKGSATQEVWGANEDLITKKEKIELTEERFLKEEYATTGETEVPDDRDATPTSLVTEDVKNEKEGTPTSTVELSMTEERRIEAEKKNKAEKELRAKSTSESVKAAKAEIPWRSDLVFPYPFVLDDNKESLQKAKTPTSRRIPKPEKVLEANAGTCEFELNFDVKPIEWTVGAWKSLLGRRIHETYQLDPSFESKLAMPSAAKDEVKMPVAARKMPHMPEPRVSPLRDQALVMEMVGSLQSTNCDFTAAINATAIRTNWEHTTSKAINYSFYMMLTCLTQIVVLLRQLLHTQSQSTATRVSLLCIGWQTVLDALLCLGHISLSLSLQPLFTAFASVAFFKLLIFCVIEMKYMAIIMQARNSQNGAQNTAELLRRQVTMLHLRFYAALMAILLAFFYAGEEYRTAYVLFLYSFWVPQIILNIATEAKRSLHHYYVYGMSVSRLVAPLYLFAVPRNFLKEVYPDAPSYPFMCQLLVLWVGVQTAILIAQGHYGARFMIPARFLPPKFDYNRPLPESLLPPGAEQVSPDASFDEGMASEVEVQTLTESARHGSTTRNRISGSRGRTDSHPTTTTETPVNTSTSSSAHTLDCVICYNGIDVHNRRGYMLAPCDHVFHRDCLMQWMDVKMECPICRTELPTL